MRIFKCRKCGNIVCLMDDRGGKLSCCGEEMLELKANTVDAAVEKHVPLIAEDGNIITVTVGEVLHPMEEKHYIEFIVVETLKGYQVHNFKPGDDPIARFNITEDDKVNKAYAYCNLHGLWMSSND